MFDCDQNLDPFDRLLHGSGHLGLRALAWVAGHKPALSKNEWFWIISLNNLVKIVNLNTHLDKVINIGSLWWVVVKEEKIWRQIIYETANFILEKCDHLWWWSSFFPLTSSESPTKYSTTPHISFIIRSFGTFLSILMLQIILIVTEYLALHSCSVVLRLGRKPWLAKSPLPPIPPPPYPPLYSQFGCEPISPILPLLLLLLPRIDQTELPQGLNWVKDVTKWQFPELKAWFLQNRLSDCQNVNQKLYFANRNSLTFTGLEA